MFGLDFLGGAKYSDVVVKNHPKGFAFGVFLEVDGFGKADKLIERMARSGKAPAIRVHLMWRDDHDFRGQLPEIQRRAARLQRIMARYPSVGWYVSPACEHNLNTSDTERLRDVVRRACPAGTFVNSVFRGAILRGEINEVHGKHPKPAGDYIYSYDGESCVDDDIEARKRQHKDARIFFLWEPRFNGRWETSDVTPRAQRKGWPDAKLIKSVVRLSRPKDVAVKMPKDWLWKSHSENKGKGDIRAEKPVLIIPQRWDSVSLVDKNGKLVARATRYKDPYEDGRWRYYFNQWGFELEAKARKQSGCSQVSIKADSFALANSFNPSFRGGSFR